MENEKNKLKNKLIPLSPNIFDKYESKARLLMESLNDCKIRNVGILSSFGGGKSSFIDSFIKLLNKKRYLVKKISFCNFGDKKLKEQDTNFLEIIILRQLFLSVDAQRLEGSSIKRAGSDRSFKKLIYTIVSFVVSLIFTIVFSFALYYREFIIPCVFKDNLSNFVITLSFLLFTSLLLLGVTIFFGSLYFSTLKIKYKDIELSFQKDDKSYSPFIQYTDELVNYFLKTRVNVVVFEDLDRTNNKNIYDNLRELNTIINNNEKIIKQGGVVFLYALVGDFFSDCVDRTKYFDLIIPIDPVLTRLNSVDTLLTNPVFEDLRVWLDDNVFIENIGPFFNDMRTLISTRNDCLIFVKDLEQENKKIPNVQNREIFTIKAFQNLFPQQYSLLEKGSTECVLFKVLEDTRTSYNTSNPFAVIRTNINVFDSFDAQKMPENYILFLKNMIELDYLNYKYEYILLSNYTNNRFTKEEQLFLDNLQSRGKNIGIFNLQSIDINRIIRKLKPSDFSLPQILAFPILDELISKKKNTKQLSMVLDLLKTQEHVDKDYINAFIVEYFKYCIDSQKENNLCVLIDSIGLQRTDLIKLANLIDNVDYRRKCCLIIATCGSNSEQILKRQTGYQTAISELSNSELFLEHLNDCPWTTPYIESKKIENLQKFSLSKNSIAGLLSNKNVTISFTYENLLYMCSVFDIKDVDSIIIKGHLSFKSYPLIFNYIVANIEEFIKTCLLNKHSNALSKESLRDLSGQKLDFELYKQLIDERTNNNIPDDKMPYDSSVFSINETLYGCGKNVFVSASNESLFRARLTNVKSSHPNEKVLSASIESYIFNLDISDEAKRICINTFLSEENCSDDICKYIINNGLLTDKNEIIFNHINDNQLKVRALILFYPRGTNSDVLKSRMCSCDDRLGKLFEDGGLAVYDSDAKIEGFDMIFKEYDLSAKKRKNKITYKISWHKEIKL